MANNPPSSHKSRSHKSRSEDADITGRKSVLFYVFMAIFVALGFFALGFMLFNLDRGGGNFEVHETTAPPPGAQPPPAPG